MSGGAKKGRPKVQLSSSGFYQTSSGPEQTSSGPGTANHRDLTVEELLLLNDQAVRLLSDRERWKRAAEMAEAVYATDPEVVAAVLSPPSEPEKDTAEMSQVRKAENLKRINDRARKRQADRDARSGPAE